VARGPDDVRKRSDPALAVNLRVRGVEAIIPDNRHLDQRLQDRRVRPPHPLDVSGRERYEVIAKYLPPGGDRGTGACRRALDGRTRGQQHPPHHPARGAYVSGGAAYGRRGLRQRGQPGVGLAARRLEPLSDGRLTMDRRYSPLERRGDIRTGCVAFYG
jgi:hypothetical protein